MKSLLDFFCDSFYFFGIRSLGKTIGIDTNRMKRDFVGASYLILLDIIFDKMIVSLFKIMAILLGLENQMLALCHSFQQLISPRDDTKNLHRRKMNMMKIRHIRTVCVIRYQHQLIIVNPHKVISLRVFAYDTCKFHVYFFVGIPILLFQHTMTWMIVK